MAGLMPELFSEAAVFPDGTVVDFFKGGDDMPLEKGSNRAVIGHNIEEMQDSGHPHDQAVAASLREAGVPKKHAAVDALKAAGKTAKAVGDPDEIDREAAGFVGLG